MVPDFPKTANQFMLGNGGANQPGDATCYLPSAQFINNPHGSNYEYRGTPNGRYTKARVNPPSVNQKITDYGSPSITINFAGQTGDGNSGDWSYFWPFADGKARIMDIDGLLESYGPSSPMPEGMSAKSLVKADWQSLQKIVAEAKKRILKDEQAGYTEATIRTELPHETGRGGTVACYFSP
jgi:hypothetical protein